MPRCKGNLWKIILLRQSMLLIQSFPYIPHRLMQHSITALKCTKGNSLTANLDYAEVTPLFVVEVFLSRIWCDLPSQLVTQILHQKQSSPRCQVAPRCTKTTKIHVKNSCHLKYLQGKRNRTCFALEKKVAVWEPNFFIESAMSFTFNERK